MKSNQLSNSQKLKAKTNSLLYSHYMNSKQYPNDNIHKFKKEKVIDQHLENVEYKRMKEIRNKVKIMEKAVDIKLSIKRQRNDSDIITKDKCDKNVEEKKEANDNLITDKKEESINTDAKISPQIDYKSAIEKILKHIEKPGSLQKCLNLLKTLLINFECINPLVVIKIFYKLSFLPFRFYNENTTIEIVRLFEYVQKEFIRIEKSEDKNEEIETASSIFSLFTIIFKEQVAFITDDSFKFNSSIKHLEKSFYEIKSFNEDEITEIKKFENLINLEEIYNQGNSSINFLIKNHEINTTLLITSLKRLFLFECLKQAFTYHKFKWALPSINSLVTKIYLDKQSLISETQIVNIDNMITILRSNTNNNTVVNPDDKIKTTPLESYHAVSDARTERIIETSLDTWQSKQMGLTYGKMHIN